MSPQPGSSPVLYEERDGVAVVTINRPERRNAIGPEVATGLRSALQRSRESSCRVVVLTGAGDRAFCAGGDLSASLADGKVAQHFERTTVADLFRQMRELPPPIVARVNGHALGGGFGLMLACDLVVASADAELGMPEVNLGLWPFMITAVVRRDVPRKLALEMMLTGRKVTAEEAAAWGIVNRVVPRPDLDAAVAELAEALAAASPVATSLGKRSFYRAEDMSFDDALEYLAGMLTVCLESEDALEGVAAFLERRRPEWKGR